jgi:hypothetical protein
MKMAEVRALFQRMRIEAHSKQIILSEDKSINIDYLIKIHNSLTHGDTPTAQRLAVDYIKNYNNEHKTRDSELNAIGSRDGIMYTSKELKEYALYLAKSNSRLDGIKSSIKRLIDEIEMFKGMFEKVHKIFLNKNDKDALRDLINKKHEADKDVDGIRAELKRLATIFS